LLNLLYVLYANICGGVTNFELNGSKDREALDTLCAQ